MPDAKKALENIITNIISPYVDDDLQFKYSYDFIEVCLSDGYRNLMVISRYSIEQNFDIPFRAIIFPSTLNAIQDLAYEIMDECDE